MTENVIQARYAVVRDAYPTIQSAAAMAMSAQKGLSAWVPLPATAWSAAHPKFALEQVLLYNLIEIHIEAVGRAIALISRLYGFG
jgi:hypothetical protein